MAIMLIGSEVSRMVSEAYITDSSLDFLIGTLSFTLIAVGVGSGPSRKLHFGVQMHLANLVYLAP